MSNEVTNSGGESGESGQSQVEPQSANGGGRRASAALVAAGLIVVSATLYAINVYRINAGHDRFEKACQVAAREGDWDYMRKVAEEWLAWTPGHADALWRAAEAAQQQDRHGDLVEILAQIPSTDPNFVYGLAEKAGVEWSELNMPLNALRTSEQVIGSEPRHTDSHSRVISFYAMTLQRVDMLRAIRRAIQAGAEPRESYCYLIMADILSFTNAAEQNQRWLRGAPDEARFKVALAVTTAMDVISGMETSPTAEMIELSQQAKKQLAGFLETYPNDSVLLSFLLYRAYRGGDIGRVSELLTRVSGNAAEDHMVWVIRAWYHTQVEEYEDAEKAIQQAIRLHPLSPLAHHEYANLLRVQQRPEVEREQRLAAYGRELRSEILLQPSAVDLSAALLLKIQSYADSCGDMETASALAARF